MSGKLSNRNSYKGKSKKPPKPARDFLAEFRGMGLQLREKSPGVYSAIGIRGLVVTSLGAWGLGSVWGQGIASLKTKLAEQNVEVERDVVAVFILGEDKKSFIGDFLQDVRAGETIEIRRDGCEYVAYRPLNPKAKPKPERVRPPDDLEVIRPKAPSLKKAKQKPKPSVPSHPVKHRLDLMPMVDGKPTLPRLVPIDLERFSIGGFVSDEPTTEAHDDGKGLPWDEPALVN